MRLVASLVLLVIFPAWTAFAQSGYFEDAYRFSRVVPGGSARIVGVGGTQWSLGGDVSNLVGNPAGLGFFRTSEASFSASYTNWTIDTKYLGQDKNFATTNFSLPNLTYVSAKPKGNLENKPFKGGAWGFGFQRIANFNSEFGYFSDILGESSIIDFYLDDAFGVSESEIETRGLAGLAYQTYLINPITTDGNGGPINNPRSYDSFVLGFPFQDENITQEGSANQLSFGYGGNFYHKIFLGGSLGIRTINFSSFKVYNEEFVNQPLANSSLRESLFINGTGINLNLGMIYKPMDNLNLGLSFQSPTWFAMSEEYDAGITANYNNYYFEQEDVTLGKEEAVTDLILSTYGINTPLKIGGGATFFFGKKGFLSADIDFIDYSTARISSNDFNEGPDNLAIRNLYTSTLNYRLGGEAIVSNFRFRAGYSYLGDPYSEKSGLDQSSQSFSGGVGIRLNTFSLDLSLVNQNYTTLYRSYQVFDSKGFNYGPITELKNSITSAILTLGISF